MKPTNYEQYRATQRTCYKLEAYLNDELVCKGEFATVGDLVADGVLKAERAVESQMKINFDWDKDLAIEQNWEG